MAKKKAASAKKPMTKSEILGSLADSSELSKKEVAGVFEDLAALIAKNLKKSGPGVFTIPGLSKIKVVRKPATKARPGHQSVHRGRDDLQSEACPQRGEDSAAQGAERHGLSPARRHLQNIMSPGGRVSLGFAFSGVVTSSTDWLARER